MNRTVETTDSRCEIIDIPPKQRLALSFDIEATGDTPFDGSMVMLGIVAVLENTIVKSETDDFWWVDSKQWCIAEEYLIGTTPKRNERCWNEFWLKNQNVWDHIQKHKVHPGLAMSELSEWLKKLSLTYDWYWIALPAAYDWMWLKYYYEKYGPSDRHPIGFKAECIKSYRHVASLLGYADQFQAFTTSKVLKITHFAVEDAEAQAFTFLRSREWCSRLTLNTEFKDK